MTVASGSVVKHLDVVEHISPGQVAGFIDSFADALFLQTAKAVPPRIAAKGIPTSEKR